MRTLRTGGADRRQFLKTTAAGAAACLLSPSPAAATTRPVTIKAVAFDGFAIFNPAPVFDLAEVLFPGHGIELSNAWRTRQFEYTWLRNSIGHYADFWHVTQDALVYAAAQTQLTLSAEQNRKLMDAYLGLKPWVDVPSILETLKKQNLRLVLLSNLTPTMLRSCVKASGLDTTFEFHLSTDQVRAFKPDPRTYNMGVEALRLPCEQVAFVAFAGWDAAGAKAFGYPTYWTNRLGLPAEELGVRPDATCSDLTDLPGFIGDLSKGAGI